MRSPDFYKASLIFRQSKSKLVHPNCTTGPLNWNWTDILYSIIHHNAVGKIWLWIQETFTVFKIIIWFKNKSFKIHPHTKRWLHSIFTAPSTVHKTRLDSDIEGCNPVGTMPKSTELHLRASTPALLGGAATTVLLLAQHGSSWSHRGRSYSMLMAVAVHIGWDPICQALSCFCLRQW